MSARTASLTQPWPPGPSRGYCRPRSSPGLAEESTRGRDGPASSRSNACSITRQDRWVPSSDRYLRPADVLTPGLAGDTLNRQQGFGAAVGCAPRFPTACTRSGGAHAGAGGRIARSPSPVVVGPRRGAGAAVPRRPARARLPALLRDALLRAALHPLVPLLHPLPGLLHQLHPARLLPRHRPRHARRPARALLVPALPGAGAAPRPD